MTTDIDLEKIGVCIEGGTGGESGKTPQEVSAKTGGTGQKGGVEHQRAK